MGFIKISVQYLYIVIIIYNNDPSLGWRVLEPTRGVREAPIYGLYKSRLSHTYLVPIRPLSDTYLIPIRRLSDKPPGLSDALSDALSDTRAFMALQNYTNLRDIPYPTTYPTAIRRLSDTYPTPIRHLSDTYLTPIRLLSDPDLTPCPTHIYHSLMCIHI